MGSPTAPLYTTPPTFPSLISLNEPQTHLLKEEPKGGRMEGVSWGTHEACCGLAALGVPGVGLQGYRSGWDPGQVTRCLHTAEVRP